MLVLLLVVGAVIPSLLLPRLLALAIYNKCPNQSVKFFGDMVLWMVKTIEIRK
ncbi:MAG: hypothetical protein WC650_02955 [Candidatus Doudnabacteria bacterium]